MWALILTAGLCATGCGRREDPAAGRRRPPPAGVLAASRRGVSPVRFVDVTEEAGITFRHESGRSPEMFYVEPLGSGVIFFDANGDGAPDLYLLNGRRLTGPAQQPAPINSFYANDGKGHFTDATASSGLGDSRYSVGVCGADYDNDGDIDLYVTNFDGPNALYRNDGHGHFTDLAVEAGVEGGLAFDSSCAFADVDGDGLVDLYVDGYVDHSLRNNKICEAKLRDGSGTARRYCVPRDYEPIRDILYRNRGDGTFEDVSETSGIRRAIGRSLGVAFADLDDDGDEDLFVSCDRTPNLYFENIGGGRFREIAMTNGTALSDEGRAQAGMGVATGDYDGDGKLDVAVTYFENESNGLYRNLGGNRFAEMSVRSGTARPSFFLMGWGTEMFDADLDGNLDWMVVNGHFIDNVALFREPVAGYAQPNLFFLNRGDGTLESLESAAGPGLGIEKVSRGLAVADIDGDGDLDVIVSNNNDRPDLLRNDSPREGKHWLMVKTVGTRSNRDGIGARLTVHLPGKMLVREVHSGQSYLSQSDLRVHLGLGSNSVVPRLEVRWPSGARSVIEIVPADQVLEILEPRD